MSGADTPQTVAFSPVDLETWQRQVLAELRGRPLETLNTTRAGQTVRPLYARRPDTDLPTGVPGWERCQRHGPGGPGLAEHIAEDLAGGIEAIWLVMEGSATAASLASSLAGARRVRLDAGGDALAAAALLVAGGAALEADGVRLCLDPLGAMASGALKAPLEETWSQAAVLIGGLAEHLPGARALTISIAPYTLAGATAAQELGIAAASLVAALRALEAHDLAPEVVAASLEWSLPMGRDVFLNVARLRALRALHAGILSSCGVSGVPAAIHAFSSPTTLTAADPWVNLLRVTTHGYAAILGGADSITTATFDEVAGIPNSLGRRIARNTQIILDEECQLGLVVDPTRGSYYVESLTAELLRDAWGQLQDIEAGGGMAAVLADGSLAAALAESLAVHRSALAHRKLPITGVSEFPILSQGPLRRSPRAPRESGPAEVPGGIDPRDFSSLLSAARAGASLSGLAAAGRSGAAPEACPPLPAHRDSARFEALRDRVEAWIIAGAPRPTAYLANLGHRSAWTPRAAFAANLLAAGGIDVIEDPGTGDASPQEAAAQLASRAGDAEVVVLCGTDDAYASHGPAVLAALPGHRMLAGRVSLPGAAGQLHLGCDAVEILTELLDVLGVN